MTSKSRWLIGLFIPLIGAFILFYLGRDEKADIQAYMNAEMYRIPNFAHISNEAMDDMLSVNKNDSGNKDNLSNETFSDIEPTVKLINYLGYFKEVVFLHIKNEGDKVATGLKIRLPDMGIIDYTKPDGEKVTTKSQMVDYYELGKLSPNDGIFMRLYFQSSINEKLISVVHDNGIANKIIDKEFWGKERFFAENLTLFLGTSLLLIVTALLVGYEIKKQESLA